jgi:hypothetical protein
MASLAAQSLLRISTQSLRSCQGRSSHLRNVILPPTVFVGLRYRRSLATGNGQKVGSNNRNDSDKSVSKESTPWKADAVSGNPNEDVPAPRKRQHVASLDFQSAEETSDVQSLITDGKSTNPEGLQDGRKQRTGAKSAKDSLSSIERRRRRLGWFSTIGMVLGLFGGWVYLGADEADVSCLFLLHAKIHYTLFRERKSLELARGSQGRTGIL